MRAQLSLARARARARAHVRLCDVLSHIVLSILSLARVQWLGITLVGICVLGLLQLTVGLVVAAHVAIALRISHRTWPRELREQVHGQQGARGKSGGRGSQKLFGRWLVFTICYLVLDKGYRGY